VASGPHFSGAAPQPQITDGPETKDPKIQPEACTTVHMDPIADTTWSAAQQDCYTHTQIGGRLRTTVIAILSRLSRMTKRGASINEYRFAD